MDGRHFSRKTFDFLEALKANNNREWFQANKKRYIRDVREPAQAFIADFAPLLDEISRHFRADPRPVGGSLFRIYRDVRFSKDKSPYKTHAGLHFRHSSGKTAHAPGFYLHLEPGGCFAGVGLWRPDGPTLRTIRNWIVDNPGAWSRATDDPGFKRSYTLEGDRLKRPPRGFDPGHPLIEVLKMRDMTGLSRLDDGDLVEHGFLDRFADLCRDGAPLVRLLCEALDQTF